MMNLKNTLILTFLFSLSSFSVTIPSITIRGLDDYQGKFITIYALSSKSELLNKKYTIHAVLKTIVTEEIKTLDLITDKLEIDTKKTRPFVTNSIIVSIHDQDVFVPGKKSHSIKSDYPKLLGELSDLRLTVNNQKFLVKKFKTLRELKRDSVLKFD